MTPMPPWLLRVTLAAYPRAFRQHFGADLADGLRTAWAAPHVTARHRLVVRALNAS
jgi:hypothetical protein